MNNELFIWLVCYISIYPYVSDDTDLRDSESSICLCIVHEARIIGLECWDTKGVPVLCDGLLF